MDKTELKYEDFKEYLPEEFEFTKSQIQFLKDTFERVTNDRDTSRVTCFNGRCGIGKSQFVSAFMHCCIGDRYQKIHEVPRGLVYVTDSIARLDKSVDNSLLFKEFEYWGDKTRERIHTEQFFEKFNDSVIILKSDDDNFLDTLRKMRYKPIVLLSTQRYFMMTPEVREALFHFTYNGKIYERDTIIFDELPYFSEMIQINVKNLTNIEAALSMGLSDEEKEKDFVMAQYKIFKDRIMDVMEEKEDLSSKRRITLYWKDSRYPSLSQNDTLFFEVIERNKESLTKQYNPIMKDLQCLRELAQNGAIFHSTKKKHGQYEKYFILVKDNRESFYIGGDKKVFIFDGTADQDPRYDVDYIEIADCSKYNIPLNTTITNISIPTPKSTICKENDGLSQVSITAISDYIKKSLEQLSISSSECLIVTYSKLATRFKKEFPNVAYFGNLKGFNDYMNLKTMAHVGMNRFPALTYFCMYCGIHMESYRALQQMTEMESMKFFDDILEPGRKKDNEHQVTVECINDLAVRCMLVDFEQNIFRLAMRNFNNTKKNYIWTFYDNDNPVYKKLSEMIEARYSRYGVEFKYEEAPLEYKEAKIKDRKPPTGKKKTKAQMFIEARDKLEIGTVYKIGTLLLDAGLDQKDLEKIKNRNPSIKAILDSDKTSKRGYYQKSS